MNFKTTIILIAILAGVSVYFFLTRDTAEQQRETETETAQAEQSLFDIKPEDVTRLSITPKDGKGKLAFEKKDGNWRMTQPADAAAETFQVDSLVRQLATLTTRGQVDAADNVTGLGSPRYTVELASKDKTVTLAIGDKSALGDHMYVRVGASAKADVVPASVSETLDQPASKYRKSRLIETAASEIRQITIEREGKKLSLQKDGSNWEITEPRRMPADASAASDLTFAITGLTANDFGTESAAHGLDQPVATIWFSTEAPSTQPAAATQPAGTTIRLGRYDDILRKNIFASVSTAPDTVIKVAASVLDSFDKTPLEIRDKKVLEIDRDTIQRITIQTDLAATTQPTTRPATKSNVIIERHVEVPPTTMPATTQAATQPAPEPVVKWVFAPTSDQALDQSKLDPILNALNPLQATKFLEQAPSATQPAGTYVLIVEAGTDSARTTHVIRITDPGGDAAPVATYNDLVFEIERSLVSHLNENLAMDEPANSTP